MSKYQQFKDWCKSIRRHKLLYFIIVVLSVICYRMLISNYMFQPFILKRDNYEDPLVLHNQLAACLQNSDEQAAAIHANNVAATADFK